MDDKELSMTFSTTIDDLVQAISDSDISSEDMVELIKKLDDGWQDWDFTKLLYDYAIKQQKKHDKEIRKELDEGSIYGVTKDDLWKKPKKAKK